MAGIIQLNPPVVKIEYSLFIQISLLRFLFMPALLVLQIQHDLRISQIVN